MSDARVIAAVRIADSAGRLLTALGIPAGEVITNAARGVAEAFRVTLDADVVTVHDSRPKPPKKD